MVAEIDEIDPRVDDLVRHLVSPVTGILQRVLLLPVGGGQVPYSHFTAAVPSYSLLPTGGDIANPGASAPVRSRSLAQVAFEAIERYCAAFVDFGQLLLSKNEGPAFEAGSKQQRFADHQYCDPGFPYIRLDADAPIHWAIGRSLVSGLRRFAPASFVFLPYIPASPAEVIGPSFSTGMAAGWSLDDAMLSGLLEVVERDAFAITWMNRLTHPTVAVSRESPLGQRIAAIESDGDTSIALVDISTDIGIPVVCAVLKRSAFGQPLVSVGLSCKLDRSIACDKALCEALSDHERLVAELRTSTRSEMWSPKSDFSDVVDFEWHGRAYVDPALHQQLDFLTAGEEVVSIDGPPSQPRLQGAIDAVATVSRHVSDILMVDLTTREFVDLGIRVVKVIVPDLVPLNADHRYPYLEHERFVTAGGRFPERTVADAVAQANVYPHPFS